MYISSPGFELRVWTAVWQQQDLVSITSSNMNLHLRAHGAKRKFGNGSTDRRRDAPLDGGKFQGAGVCGQQALKGDGGIGNPEVHAAADAQRLRPLHCALHELHMRTVRLAPTSDSIDTSRGAQAFKP